MIHDVLEILMINDVCRNNSHKEIMIINYAMKGHISCFMLMVIRINLLYNDLKNEYLLFMYSQAVLLKQINFAK